MGVASGRARFATIPDETFQEAAPGPIAVVCQSGAMCASINRAINRLGLKIAYLVSCGNQIGCTVGEAIDYCADQPELRVILCYVESIPDADRFLRAGRRARQNGKTVVAVKIGGSAAARAAALTHTGAMAGRSEVFDAFAAAAGIVRVRSLEDAVEAVEFLARSPLPHGRNAAFMTNSGALCSLILEAAGGAGAALAQLSQGTRQALNEVLGLTDAGNPFDHVDELVDRHELVAADIQRLANVAGHQPQRAGKTVVDIHEASRLPAVAPDFDLARSR